MPCTSLVFLISSFYCLACIKYSINVSGMNDCPFWLSSASCSSFVSYSATCLVVLNIFWLYCSLYAVASPIDINSLSRKLSNVVDQGIQCTLLMVDPQWTIKNTCGYWHQQTPMASPHPFLSRPEHIVSPDLVAPLLDGAPLLTHHLPLSPQADGAPPLPSLLPLPHRALPQSSQESFIPWLPSSHCWKKGGALWQPADNYYWRTSTGAVLIHVC